MYYFTELGELIHQYFDDKKLLIVYVFSAIMGATFSVVSVLLGLRYDSVSVGASGAVFGLLGMIMTSSWKSDRNPEGIALPIDYVQLLPYVVFSLIIGFLIPGINNSAHIGGLLGGMILGLIIRPNYGNVSGLPTPVKDGFYYLSLGIIAVSFLSLVIFNINLQS
jgi:membrane associated rhomboid family serine protease